MPHKSEAHRALELLEEYHAALVKPADQELKKHIEKLISTFKGNLFQALCDIQDLYDNTLMNETVGVYRKIDETRRFAQRWENNPPFGGFGKTLSIERDGNTLAREYATKTREDPTGVVTQTTSSTTLTDEHGREWEVEDVVLEKNLTGLGFSISGGVDKHPDVDIKVTDIAEGGAVFRDGRIRIGDIIMKVDNVNCEGVPHSTAVEALKSAGSVVRLLVKREKLGSAPLPPVHKPYLSTSSLPYSSSSLAFRYDKPREIQELELSPGVQRIELYKDSSPNNKGLGFSIAGGIGNEHYAGDTGIYITRIIENTPAYYDARLRQGDQLLAVDNTILRNVTHQFAVDTLKSTGNKVTLLFRKNPHPDVEDSMSRSLGSQSHLNFGQPAEVPLTTEARWVTLRKGEVGLGFNIVGGEDGEPIYVSHVLPGGVADVSNNVRKGDVLLQVNDTILERATHSAAAQALKNCAPNSNVRLLLQYRPLDYQQFEEKVDRLRNDLIQRNQTQAAAAATVGVPIPPTYLEEPVYVRALFDNDPSRDPGVPPRALQFKYGDVLHVLSREDDDWWKARKVSEFGMGEGPEGVVPSKKRVEKRERQRRKQVNFNQGSQSLGRNSTLSGLEGRRGSRSQLSFSRKFPFVKSTEKLNELSENEFAEDPIFAYEPVQLQQINYTRPVIVLGALKDRINDELVNRNPARFGSCVPHTSRPPRDNEINGRDYYFVSKSEMERDVKNNLFIEAGQFQNNLYGTSIQAVKAVANEGKHCILDVSGNAIRRLRSTAGIQPISIFVKPHNAHQLRDWDPQITEEEAFRLMDRCQRQEQSFGDLFSAVVTGHTFEDVLSRALRVIQEQSRPQAWVPDGSVLL